MVLWARGQAGQRRWFRPRSGEGEREVPYLVVAVSLQLQRGMGLLQTEERTANRNGSGKASWLQLVSESMLGSTHFS